MIERGLKAFSTFMFNRGSAVGIDRISGLRYLDRHYLYREPGKGGHLLHRFNADDPDEPHDHPWPSRTWILCGRYVEDVFRRSAIPGNGPVFVDSYVRESGYRSPWQSATRIHRIRLINNQPVWTLFSYGKRERDWFFHLPDGTLRPGEDTSKARTGGTLTGRFLPRITAGTQTDMESIQQNWSEGRDG